MHFFRTMSSEYRALPRTVFLAETGKENYLVRSLPQVRPHFFKLFINLRILGIFPRISENLRGIRGMLRFHDEYLEDLWRIFGGGLRCSIIIHPLSLIPFFPTPLFLVPLSPFPLSSNFTFPSFSPDENGQGERDELKDIFCLSLRRSRLEVIGVTLIA